MLFQTPKSAKETIIDSGRALSANILPLLQFHKIGRLTQLSFWHFCYSSLVFDAKALGTQYTLNRYLDS